MKEIRLIIAMLMICIVPALAQQEKTERKTAEQRASLITKNMTEKLKLSTSQSDSVHDVILKREKYRDAGILTDDKKKETEAEMKKILTKEQHQQWKEMRKEAHEHHQQKGAKKEKNESPAESK